MLLVIDSCEHVAEEVAGLVDRLPSSCGALRLLATSREPLGVPGERVWRIPPLGMPDADDHDLSTWRTASAALLFADRARGARPEFTLDDTTLPVVAQLCRDLDGLPLALELAAARLRHLTLTQLAGRLSDRLRLLTGGPRTVHSRHQTIRALLEWSYEPLGESERLLFRRLAVFRGSFSLEAAEALCGSGPPAGDALDVLDGLGDLVDRSLVALTELPDGEPGYRLLVLVRDYGQRCSRRAVSLRRCGLATWPGCLLRAGTFLTGRWSAASVRRSGRGSDASPMTSGPHSTTPSSAEMRTRPAFSVGGSAATRSPRPLAGGQRVGHACPEAAGRSA